MMRREAAVAMFGVLAWVGCGSSGPSEAERADHRTQVMRCGAERATVEAVVEAYRSENDGDRPSSIEDLTPAYLRHNPKYWTIRSGGQPERIKAGTVTTKECNLRKP